MIVCVCRNVSGRSVTGAIRSGARTAAEVMRATGAGTGCGACRATIEALVARAPCAAAAPCPGCPRAAAGGDREAA